MLCIIKSHICRIHRGTIATCHLNQVMQPGHYQRNEPTILLPLYIYPQQGAWDPLVTAAEKHPGIRFTAIINPQNGPGETPGGDNSYRAALWELAALENVICLAYVHCSWGVRELDEVKKDVGKWAAWNTTYSRRTTPLRGDRALIEGLFVDETPGQDDGDGLNGEYLGYVVRYARDVLGKDAFVVFNPGMVVSDERLRNGADLVVEFENKLDKLSQLDEHLHGGDESHTEDGTANNLATRSTSRMHLGCKRGLIIHSVASARGNGPGVTTDGFVDLEDMVHDLVVGRGAGALFVTSLGGGEQYTSWCPLWEPFVRAFAKVAGAVLVEELQR